MKVYAASPFFNRFQILVKSKMLKKLKEMDVEVFDPQSTDASKSYDKSPGAELAKVIFDENVKHVKDCDILVFPAFTNDLGTLMELGLALQFGKKILRYNYLSDKMESVNTNLNLYIIEDSFIQLKTPSDAIMLGYNYGGKHKIYYDVGNLHDNIMLSCAFTRVEQISDKEYRTKVVNYKEVA